jgi:hypothetical protein
MLVMQTISNRAATLELHCCPGLLTSAGFASRGAQQVQTGLHWEHFCEMLTDLQLV